MKGSSGLISKSTLKEMRRMAVIGLISFGNCGFGASILALKECREENDQLRKYIISGKAGKYGGCKEAKQNWDTEIPPIMAYKPDHLTEILNATSSS